MMLSHATYGFAYAFTTALNGIVHDSIDAPSELAELVDDIRMQRSCDRIELGKRAAQANARAYLARSYDVRLIVLQADRKPHAQVVNDDGTNTVVVLRCRDPLMINPLERNCHWLLEANFAWQPRPQWHKQPQVRPVLQGNNTEKVV